MDGGIIGMGTDDTTSFGAIAEVMLGAGTADFDNAFSDIY